MTTKFVGFAYPTSSAAGWMGRAKTGTYYVFFGETEPTTARHFATCRIFSTRQEALAYAETSPLEYSRWSFKPEKAQ